MRFRILAVIAAIAAVAGGASPALASRPPESPSPAAGRGRPGDRLARAGAVTPPTWAAIAATTVTARNLITTSLTRIGATITYSTRGHAKWRGVPGLLPE